MSSMNVLERMKKIGADHKISDFHVLDWIGCKWGQPYIPGEKSFLSKKEMAELIDQRKNGEIQLELEVE